MSEIESSLADGARERQGQSFGAYALALYEELDPHANADNDMAG